MIDLKSFHWYSGNVSYTLSMRWMEMKFFLDRAYNEGFQHLIKSAFKFACSWRSYVRHQWLCGWKYIQLDQKRRCFSAILLYLGQMGCSFNCHYEKVSLFSAYSQKLLNAFLNQQHLARIMPWIKILVLQAEKNWILYGPCVYGRLNVGLLFVFVLKIRTKWRQLKAISNNPSQVKPTNKIHTHTHKLREMKNSITIRKQCAVCLCIMNVTLVNRLVL